MKEPNIANDIELPVAIFLEALSFRPHIRRRSSGEHFSAITLEQIETEILPPGMQVLFLGQDGRVPCLFFRFVGDVSPIVEAILYPIEPIRSFLAESRAHFQLLNLTERTQESIEKLARKMAVEMTLIMIDSFSLRSGLMMDSFVWEVMGQWYVQHSKNIRHWTAERGDSIPKGMNPRVKQLADILQQYARKVSKFWRHQSETYEGGDKIRLADEYDRLYAHWKILRTISSERSWREYARANHPDTPDDLLEQMENTDRGDGMMISQTVSALALEHAARRAGLIKQRGVSEGVRKQRRAGIKVSGYTSTQLFEFLQQGRQLRNRLPINNLKNGVQKEAVSELEATAQVSFENSSEQKALSAQTKK